VPSTLLSTLNLESHRRISEKWAALDILDSADEKKMDILEKTLVDVMHVLGHLPKVLPKKQEI